MNKHRSFSLQSHAFEYAIKPSDLKHDLFIKPGRAKIGIFQKMCSKNLRGSVRSDLEKLDSFAVGTSKNHLIRNFLRNGRLWVKLIIIILNSVEQFFSKNTKKASIPLKDTIWA